LRTFGNHGETRLAGDLIMLFRLNFRQPKASPRPEQPINLRPIIAAALGQRELSQRVRRFIEAVQNSGPKAPAE